MVILAPVSDVDLPLLERARQLGGAVGVLDGQDAVGATSSSVTSVPKALKTSANSQPTAPAPTMAIVFGALLEHQHLVRREDGGAC